MLNIIRFPQAQSTGSCSAMEHSERKCVCFFTVVFGMHACTHWTGHVAFFPTRRCLAVFVCFSAVTKEIARSHHYFFGLDVEKKIKLLHSKKKGEKQPGIAWSLHSCVKKTTIRCFTFHRWCDDTYSYSYTSIPSGPRSDCLWGSHYLNHNDSIQQIRIQTWRELLFTYKKKILVLFISNVYPGFLHSVWRYESRLDSQGCAAFNVLWSGADICSQTPLTNETLFSVFVEGGHLGSDQIHRTSRLIQIQVKKWSIKMELMIQHWPVIWNSPALNYVNLF